MSIEVEFALKKDIRNNPVVREFDVRQKREFHGITWLAVFVVGLLLFSAWQRLTIIQYGIAIESRRADQGYEETINRQLRLNLETERAPQRVDERARRELGLAAPTDRDTIILERQHQSSSSGAMVALAR
jgi:hypothetical protein